MADTPRRPRKAAPKKAAKPIGRPSKLTPELAARIVEKLRIGCYVEEAAAACGIAKPSVYSWQKTGAQCRDRLDSGEAIEADLSDHEKECVLFLNAVEAAQEEWFANANDQLAKFSVGEDGRLTKEGASVLMWRLERKNPGRYGRRAPIDVNVGGQVGNPVQVQVDVSVAELAAKLAAVREDS